VIGVVLASLLGTWTAPARAGDGEDAAAATQLFNAGRDLMRANDYAAACPKLAESARLQATVGALAKLAECEEHEGRRVSAYARWQQALNLARSTGDERTADVERETARLDAIVPKLRIVAGGPMPPDVVIRLDTVELGLAGLGVPLPVEPGTHTLQVSAPHKASWSTRVETAGDGATTPITIPPLEDESSPALPPAPAFRAAAARLPPPESQSWRTVGVIATATGVAALAGGTVLGLVALHQRDVASCPGNVCPDEASANTLRAAKSSADVSTALFIAGGVLAAGGLAVWWLSPDARHTVGLAVTPAGVSGSF
jgi:hypothetical protein